MYLIEMCERKSKTLFGAPFINIFTYTCSYFISGLNQGSLFFHFLSNKIQKNFSYADTCPFMDKILCLARRYLPTVDICRYTVVSVHDKFYCTYILNCVQLHKRELSKFTGYEHSSLNSILVLGKCVPCLLTLKKSSPASHCALFLPPASEVWGKVIFT